MGTQTEGYIAPQITKQLLASQQPINRRIIVDLAVEQYTNDHTVKEKFDEQNIIEINVRQVIGDILETDPIIGVPIDGITNDLKDWARTLKYKVKLWVLTKFVEFNNPQNIVFEFPEEFKPVLDTEQEEEEQNDNREINSYDVEIIDLIDGNLLNVGDSLIMSYRPRNGQPKRYEATILEDGSLSVLDQVFGSPSYAALAGISDAGSTRQTVNGWTSWKTQEGRTLAELREQYLLSEPNEDQHERTTGVFSNSRGDGIYINFSSFFVASVWADVTLLSISCYIWLLEQY